MGAVGLTVATAASRTWASASGPKTPDSRDFFIADNLFLGREDHMRLIGWNQAGSRAAGIYPSHQLAAFSPSRSTAPDTSSPTMPSPTFTTPSASRLTARPRPIPSAALRRSTSTTTTSTCPTTTSSKPTAACTTSASSKIAASTPPTTATARSPSSGARSTSSATCSIMSRRRGVQIRAAPAGLLVYHNTMIGEQTARDPYANAHFRNNLFLGRDTPNRGIMTWANATADYSSDYNGFRPNRGVEQAIQLARARPGKTPTSPNDSDWQSFAHARRIQRPPARRPTASKSITTSSRNMTPPDPAPKPATASTTRWTSISG